MECVKIAREVDALGVLGNHELVRQHDSTLDSMSMQSTAEEALFFPTNSFVKRMYAAVLFFILFLVGGVVRFLTGILLHRTHCSLWCKNVNERLHHEARIFEGL